MKLKQFIVCGLIAVLLIALAFTACKQPTDPPPPTTCTVTFELDGGNIDGNPANVQRTVNIGGTVANMPTTPSKADKTFGGWFAEKDGAGTEFTASTTVTIDITLYAKWETANSNNPIAHAGTNQTQTLASDLTVTLNGTGSMNSTEYAWECVSYTADKGQVYVPYSAAEVAALIGGANQATATVEVRKAGTYVFKLTVADAGLTDTKNVTVTVVPPTSPITATVKITGRDFSGGANELDLSIADYCSFEGAHDGFTEDDFEKITFDFFSGSYNGPGSEDRSTGDLDKYIDDGKIPASEYGNDDSFPYITQTFYYDNQPDTVGSRSFWAGAYFSQFYDLYDGEPDWNSLPAIPTATLTLSKQITDLVTSTATVTEITVVSPPAKIAYDFGESLNLTGLVVRASYSNNTTQIVGIGHNHVRGFDNQLQETQTVTVSFGGQTATFNVSVNWVAVSSVSLNKTSIDLTVGDTEKLTATIQPVNAKNKNVNWLSNNTEIATVDEDGTVTAVALGSTTIKVTTVDGGETAECTVTVNPYTVTFNSNGGSDVNPITGVNPGSTITEPMAPTYDYGTFAGWCSDANLTTLFVFSTPINGNITLYAKWNLTLNLGDTGPGGGKIFYVSEMGFTMTDTGENCHYLEAAPADMAENLAWASAGFTTRQINTATAIGTGRNNTAIVLAIDANAPAFKACNEYTDGGKTDWFLPSKDELNQLYINRSVVGNLNTNQLAYPDYWTSSSYISNTASRQDFYDGLQNDYREKTRQLLVRAIRAF